MQFEIQSAKNVAYVSFLVLITPLVAYATILPFDKVTIIDKAFGQLPTSLSSPSSRISIKIVHPDYGQITNVKNNQRRTRIANSDYVKDKRKWNRTTATAMAGASPSREKQISSSDRL